MPDPLINPLDGMKNAPLDTKVAALMDLLFRYKKELAVVPHLLHAVSLVAQEFMDASKKPARKQTRKQ